MPLTPEERDEQEGRDEPPRTRERKRAVPDQSGPLTRGRPSRCWSVSGAARASSPRRRSRRAGSCRRTDAIRLAGYGRLGMEEAAAPHDNARDPARRLVDPRPPSTSPSCRPPRWSTTESRRPDGRLRIHVEPSGSGMYAGSPRRRAGDVNNEGAARPGRPAVARDEETGCAGRSLSGIFQWSGIRLERLAPFEEIEAGQLRGPGARGRTSFPKSTTLLIGYHDPRAGFNTPCWTTRGDHLPRITGPRTSRADGTDTLPSRVDEHGVPNGTSIAAAHSGFRTVSTGTTEQAV